MHETLFLFLLLIRQTLTSRYPPSRNAGGHIRFEAKSAGKAMAWVESIRQAIHEEEERERQRVSINIVCVLKFYYVYLTNLSLSLSLSLQVNQSLIQFN